MSERLVPYVEPRARKPLSWVVFASSAIAVVAVRFAVGYEPVLLIATFCVVMFAGVFAQDRWARRRGAEMMSVAERARRYLSEESFIEGALTRGAMFGIIMAPLLVRSFDTPGSAAAVAIVYPIGGLVFGIFTDWITRRTLAKSPATTP